MDDNECFEALVGCHTRFSNGNGTPIEVPNFHATDKLSGYYIAKRFAEEATKTLSQAELVQLIKFLENPKANYDYLDKEPQDLLRERLQVFYEMETQYSGLSTDRLSIPGGPEDADLCIVLHIATGKHTSRDFWDPKSATISLLQEKGLTEEFVFGYDWHWRAEDASYLTRSDCPLRKWPQNLKALHDQVSAEILELLPLPFLITASGCTRENVRRTLTGLKKSIDITISESTTLKLDLDFRTSFLRRIIVHTHHPSSGFISNSGKRATMAAQIDAGLNFFMWLTGRVYDTNTFGRTYSQAGPPGKRNAPRAEIWVARYLFQDPAVILAQEHSVAGAALSKIRAKMSISHRQQNHRRKKKDNTSIGDDMPLFHGKIVTVLRSGAVKLNSPKVKCNLQFRMAQGAARMILDLQKEVRIYFSQTKVELRVEDQIVYHKPIERLLTSVNGDEWLVQITKELGSIQEDSNVLDERTKEIIPAQLVVRPHDPRLGAGWKNGELQRKLLHGSVFSCAKINNAARVGRISFRGVQLYIPQEADFDTVFVQCDLVDQGLKHTHMSPTLFEADDPATRLGVKVKYRVKATNEPKEYWATFGGTCNTKILNSLVDFLEGKDEKWTENQDRRFLARSVFRGRTHVSYTS
ncbi:hypothetical protein FE257_000478 [Aspergillus nanangensis]|uniref:Uncharacterized protein n=1 Tax=Aspergillus nanangensis TaxID=2582783 RepID=A0AAD4GYR1_ASPNN|nr:hypothetical protein FE257_000478 [Aspergillus nanangensis]